MRAVTVMRVATAAVENSVRFYLIARGDSGSGLKATVACTSICTFLRSCSGKAKAIRDIRVRHAVCEKMVVERWW